MKTFFILLFAGIIFSQTKYPEINSLIEQGEYRKAKVTIEQKLSDDNLSDQQKYYLNFEIDKMDRIKKDFRRTKDEIKKQLEKYYPNLTDEMIIEWEKDGSLEMKIINGEKRYFNSAVPNLFRINKDAKKTKQAVEGKTYHSTLNEFLSSHLPASVKKSLEEKRNIINPVRMKIKYTLTVDKDAIPDGEVIRAWLPYPREGHERQKDIKLILVNSDNYIIADNSFPQRTLYLEKAAKEGEPTVFQMELEYTAYSEWYDVDPDKVKSYDKNSELYKEYTSERHPHIIFTDRIKNLSEEIVSNETNPYKKIMLIYQWIDSHIPWASAREYSTLENISDYCLENMHGDCGIKTLLFMTLARYNGIPCKWQSGWMMHPGSLNLHDWSEIYLESYGWIPLDQDFGLQKSDNPKVKYFYTNGIDSYRLIVNNDYAQPLFPAKIFPRSETQDFQRGEVEWKGGNLYFDKWDYNMEVEYPSP